EEGRAFVNLELRWRPSSLSRCAVCHDGLGERALVCTRCSTWYHAECGASIARCPTLGCGTVQWPELGAAMARARNDERLDKVLVTAPAISCLTTLVVLVAWLYAGARHSLRPGADPASGANVFLLCAAEVHLFIIPAFWAVWLRRPRTLGEWSRVIGGVFA